MLAPVARLAQPRWGLLAQAVAEVLDTAFVPAGRTPGSPGPGQAGYRLPPAVRPRVAGWRVAIVDHAINAGTAVAACFRLIRESGAVPVAAGALLALGREAATVEATMSVPCYAAATRPSQVWPAAHCPLCITGIPLTAPDSAS
jgi:hypothetical protein